MITKIIGYGGFNHIRSTISAQNFGRKQERLFEDEKMNSYYEEAEKIYEEAKEINKSILDIQTNITHYTNSSEISQEEREAKLKELSYEKGRLVSKREQLVNRLDELSLKAGIRFSSSIYWL